MEELINVNFDRQTVSARELWERLDRPYTEFLKWFNAYKEYGFVDGQDYRALRVKVRTAQVKSLPSDSISPKVISPSSVTSVSSDTVSSCPCIAL